MTAAREGGVPPAPGVVPPGTAADCGHLDEDAEAIEDPVHSGDAIHQHELHELQRRPAD